MFQPKILPIFSYLVSFLYSYEPLEFTLQKFRIHPSGGIDSVAISEALEKFLDMDIGELIEHPQWQELISTALFHVTGTALSDELKVKCIQFMTRLSLGLPGAQVTGRNIL